MRVDGATAAAVVGRVAIRPTSTAVRAVSAYPIASVGAITASRVAARGRAARRACARARASGRLTADSTSARTARTARAAGRTSAASTTGTSTAIFSPGDTGPRAVAAIRRGANVSIFAGAAHRLVGVGAAGDGITRVCSAIVGVITIERAARPAHAVCVAQLCAIAYVRVRARRPSGDVRVHAAGRW